MNRLEFIFTALNAIATKGHSPTIECLLVHAVLREIEILKRELRHEACPWCAASGLSMPLVAPEQSDVRRQAS